MRRSGSRCAPPLSSRCKKAVVPIWPGPSSRRRSELRAGPRGERLYQALARTYFEPAATQELAAERLGLPFSTYRYQLAGGIRRVTERLWQRELHGDD